MASRSAHVRSNLLFITSKRKQPHGRLQKFIICLLALQIPYSFDPKYRYKILKDKGGKELYRSIHILCNVKDCEVLELNVQPDHVHLSVIVPPKLSVLSLLGVLKGRTAIRLFNKSPHKRKKLWGNYFWARGILQIRLV